MKGFALVLVLLPLAASAATLTVNTTADNTTAGNGRCTLREAIANVNAAADTTGGDCGAGNGAGDTITFALAMPAKIRLALGQLLIQRDVNIVNPAPGSLHIDGFGRSRVFEIAAGTTTMSNVTIERGRALTFGGGILVDDGASLNLVDCAVAANTAVFDVDGDAEEVSGGGIYNAGSLSLTDCTLTRNTLLVPDPADNSADTYGGGIHNEGGTVVLTDCTLRKNTAIAGQAGSSYGGGISSRGGTVSLNGCSLIANQIRSDFPSWGGGIYADQDTTATVSNCSFTKNSNWGGADSYSFGGAISNWGSMSLRGCTVTHNATIVKEISESYAGGIHNMGIMTMTDCTLASNVALTNGTDSTAAYGGAVYNGNSSDASGPSILSVTNCTFSRNRTTIHSWGSSWGAGIDNAGTASMTNCTLVGNRATAAKSFFSDAAGGGVYNEVTITLTNCTIDMNTAAPLNDDQGTGGGGNILSAGDTTLTNTVVAHGGIGTNCVGAIISGGHNLSSDGACFAGGGSDRLHTNPRLARLGDYGGPTQTMALCAGPGVPTASCTTASPAIDAGDDAVLGPPDNLTTDQRGLPRQAGAHVDIGAYEAQ